MRDIYRMSRLDALAKIRNYLLPYTVTTSRQRLLYETVRMLMSLNLLKRLALLS